MRRLTALLFVAACAPKADAPQQTKSTMSPEMALEALDVFWRSGQPEHSLRLPIELSSRISADAAATGDVSLLAEAWSRLAPCSEPDAADATVEVQFGDLDDGCDLVTSPVAGGIHYEVQADGDDVTAALTLLPFEASTWSAEGALAFTWGGDEVHGLSADLHWHDHHGPMQVVTDATYALLQPGDGLWGLVEVDGTREVTTGSGRWRIELIGAQVQHPLPMPMGGAARIVGPDGSSLYATFSPSGDEDVRIDIEGTARALAMELIVDESVLRLVD